MVSSNLGDRAWELDLYFPGILDIIRSVCCQSEFFRELPLWEGLANFLLPQDEGENAVLLRFVVFKSQQSQPVLVWCSGSKRENCFLTVWALTFVPCFPCWYKGADLCLYLNGLITPCTMFCEKISRWTQPCFLISSMQRAEKPAGEMCGHSPEL